MEETVRVVLRVLLDSKIREDIPHPHRFPFELRNES